MWHLCNLRHWLVPEIHFYHRLCSRVPLFIIGHYLSHSFLDCLCRIECRGSSMTALSSGCIRMHLIVVCWWGHLCARVFRYICRGTPRRIVVIAGIPCRRCLSLRHFLGGVFVRFGSFLALSDTWSIACRRQSRHSNGHVYFLQPLNDVISLACLLYLLCTPIIQ